MPTRYATVTKSKLLDAAETLYAEHGQEGVTLRQITQVAGVNLAAVNYHFRSKEALIQAMSARLLDPLCFERLDILNCLEGLHPGQLRPLHVIASVVIPMIVRQASAGQETHYSMMLRRLSSDPSPVVRDYISRRYASVSERFDAALQMCVPGPVSEEVRWRARTLINAVPSTVGNLNTGIMIGAALAEPGMTMRTLLVRFGKLWHAVIGVDCNETELVRETDQMLRAVVSAGLLPPGSLAQLGG
ncbi:TetR/AcrR family transcriptional regulator [Chitinasiproducens palmae]|uniref:DNA-binding transcriptional regulator, AcrR family n=1 Tax=Chitinasiproducens palmae TaxID=1770053 RepID=A0A1H2PV82_9BURK|nr:TetR/AcrR family transcriptional regulator [Chitinasiproducens palmae]SDV51149.1 DNA-binding transcriptional regulator, AcrR family [Chitinasiproducens palmae]